MKYILRIQIMAFFLFCNPNFLCAQWTQAGLYDTGVKTFAVIDTCIFAGTLYDGLFSSTNNGTSWKSEAGLNAPGGIYILAVSGKKLIAGTGNGLFVSANNSGSWTTLDSGLTNPDSRFIVSALAVKDTMIFVGLDFLSGGGVNGVFRSTNDGKNWFALDGISNASSFAFIGSHIFAVSRYITPYGNSTEGVFISTNNGDSWSDINADLYDTLIINALAVKDSSLFAGTSSGMYLFENNRSRWSTLDSGLWIPNVTALSVSDGNIFAATDFGGVFVSTNNGTSWRGIMNNEFPYNSYTNALVVSGPIFWQVTMMVCGESLYKK